MANLSHLGSSLRMTNSQIEMFSKQNPKTLPKEAVKEMTTTAKDIGDRLAKTRSGPSQAGVDAAMLKSMVANINKIHQKTPEKPQKELGQMLEALDYLKNKLEKYQSRRFTSQAKLAQRITSSPQILTRQLNSASKELAHLKQALQTESRVTDAELKQVEKLLKQTEGAVVKELSVGKALTVPPMPGKTQNVIGKILEDIKFLHYTLSAQVKAGTARVQASSFRLTLRKVKDRLRALQKLNKTRGEMAAQAEMDSQR